MGKKCYLPTIDVVGSEAFPKNVPVTHVATNVNFGGHVQITTSLLTHVDLWDISKSGNSCSAKRGGVHESRGVCVYEATGAAARITSAQGRGISRLQPRTGLPQPPSHRGGPACQARYASPVHLGCHSAVKSCLQRAAKQNGEVSELRFRCSWETRKSKGWKNLCFFEKSSLCVCVSPSAHTCLCAQ